MKYCRRHCRKADLPPSFGASRTANGNNDFDLEMALDEAWREQETTSSSTATSTTTTTAVVATPVVAQAIIPLPQVVNAIIPSPQVVQAIIPSFNTHNTLVKPVQYHLPSTIIVPDLSSAVASTALTHTTTTTSYTTTTTQCTTTKFMSPYVSPHTSPVKVKRTSLGFSHHRAEVVQGIIIPTLSSFD